MPLRSPSPRPRRCRPVRVAPAPASAAPAEETSAGGFTLVELMISLLVFAIVMGGLAISVNTALGLTRNNRNRSLAAYAAAAEIETARRLNFQSLATSGTVTRTDGALTITREARAVPVNATPDSCGTSTDSTSPQALRVSVVVTWNDMRGTAPVRSDTMITPTYGSASEVTGSLLARITDAAGDAVAGQQVTITGPSTSRTLSTDSGGCALFSFVKPGAWTASLVGATALIDNTQTTPPPGKPVTVTVQRQSEAAFVIDQPGTLAVTTNANLSGYRLPLGVDIAVYNSATGATVVPGQTGSALAAAPQTFPSFKVFPFGTAYSVWAGTCSDSRPAAGATSITAAAGTTVNGTVQMGRLQVRMATAPASGQTYSLVATSAASGCTETYTFTGTALSNTVTSNFALPFGAWSIRARRDSTATLGTAQTVNLGPASAVSVTNLVRP